MSSHSNHDKGRLGALSLAALGVVYGDIGTSPLYAMKEVFAGAHHPVPITVANVLGILSIIFWSLMMVVSLKYVSFILRADNKGEGGIMALMALALRESSLSSRRRKIVIAAGLFGAALFYGDGVITPAISVLSAVEGLEIATPALKRFVVPLSLIILIALFMMQKKGTATVGKLFGPIMVLWFFTLAALGIYNIALHPDVLRALNPFCALEFLRDNKFIGFLALGGTVLVLTGAEALYADMGHFGRMPIRIAWFGMVLPALVLNYFGQGALLIADSNAISNPFYLLAPEWALYPMVALSTAATVIASQAVISGAFSVTQQAIQLGYSPRMQITHTSDSEIGQIYLPGINWTQLAIVIALVIGFGSSSALAAAYGVAATGTMFITNILAFMVARYLWGWPLWRAMLGVAPFVIIDVCLTTATSAKIVDGGWFPLVFGSTLFLLLITWKRGREILASRLAEESMPLKAFIDTVGSEVQRVDGTAVFLTPHSDRVPQSLLHSLKHYKVLHETMVLVSIEILDVPHLSESQRVSVERLPHCFWRVKVFYGFMERIDLPHALEWCAERGLDIEPMRTSFFLGRETLIPRPQSEMWFWREKLFAAMFRNAGSVATYFNLPANRVVELGSQVVL